MKFCGLPGSPGFTAVTDVSHDPTPLGTCYNCTLGVGWNSVWPENPETPPPGHCQECSTCEDNGDVTPGGVAYTTCQCEVCDAGYGVTTAFFGSSGL